MPRQKKEKKQLAFQAALEKRFHISACLSLLGAQSCSTPGAGHAPGVRLGNEELQKASRARFLVKTDEDDSLPFSPVGNFRW